MTADTLLADRIEIADLFTRFARLLDEERWEDAGTVFTEEVTVRSPRAGEVRGIGELVGYLRQSEVAGVHTQHTHTDLLVEVSGDRAAASANSLVYYYRDGQAPHLTSGLRLTCVAVRTRGGWRLDEVGIALAWSRED